MYYTLKYTTLTNTVISIAAIADTFSGIILTDSFTIKITNVVKLNNPIIKNKEYTIIKSKQTFLNLFVVFLNFSFL